MAKLFASEIAVSVANECVQIHGGYGFIKDYPAEKYYRDVKLCTIGEAPAKSEIGDCPAASRKEIIKRCACLFQKAPQEKYDSVR